MQQNYLDKPDYCIRKAIGVYCIPQYLQETGVTQRKLAEPLGVAQTTISKWMNTEGVEDNRITSNKDSRYAPSLIHILRMSAYFQKPLYMMLEEVIAAERSCSQFINKEMLGEVEQLVQEMKEKIFVTPHISRKGEDHFTIINKLQKSRYVGFFISANEDKHIEHFIIDTAMAVDTATVPASMRIVGKAENQYRCNVASPPNQSYLYINIEQQSGKHDMGTLAFCVDDDMQGPFMCGSGYIMSTDRKSGENRIQWTVILRVGTYNDVCTPGFEHLTEHSDSVDRVQQDAAWLNEVDCEFVERNAVRQADAIVEPVLSEKLPSPSGYYISFSCLKDRQKEFYESVYRRQLVNLEFIKDWNDTHNH